VRKLCAFGPQNQVPSNGIIINWDFVATVLPNCRR
jgi:hypothetical protein